MPTMTVLVDGTIPVAEDLNGNWRRLNQAVGVNTSITTYAMGDLLYGSTTDTLARRAIGATGEVLTVVGGVPTWSSSGAVAGIWQQRNLQGTLTTGSLTVSADAVTLRNSALAVKVHQSVSGIVIDPATAGLNGRDQAGAFSADQDLYAYWISDGTSIRGVWADNAPPTGPDLTTLAAFAGYTYWGYIGAFKWTAGSAFVPATLRGTRIFYTPAISVLTDGQATTETAISLVSAVPAVALRVTCWAQHLLGGATALQVRLSAGGGNVYAPPFAGSLFLTTLALTVPNVSQALYYLHGGAPGALNGLYLTVSDYTVANGGE